MAPPIDYLRPSTNPKIKKLSSLYNEITQHSKTFVALKLVLITLKGIGHQMSPSAEFGLGSQQLNSLSNNRLMVNSNLFSLSIVADQRALKNSPIKVDLASPLELVFRHLEPLTWSVGNVQQQQQPRCVYWDSNIR